MEGLGGVMDGGQGEGGEEGRGEEGGGALVEMEGEGGGGGGGVIRGAWVEGGPEDGCGDPEVVWV